MKDAQTSSTHRVSRRAFLQGLGFGSLALVAAACAAPSAPAPASAPAAEAVTLDFFAWGDQCGA